MAALFSANSDEPYAERIAKEIDHTRHKDGAVRTTMQLHAAISRALSFLPEGEERKEAVRKSSQRCFQALQGSGAKVESAMFSGAADGSQQRAFEPADIS